MLSKIFTGLSLAGSEWVLYLLIVISVLSFAVIFERWRFFKCAQKDLEAFRGEVRKAAASQGWDSIGNLSKKRRNDLGACTLDCETELSETLIQARGAGAEALERAADDVILRGKLRYEKGLGILATVGSNAPFVGLFGTVLGIIQAFHDLSKQAGTGVQTVTAGISEALVATAVGILVAIPAVVAFNLYQRKVKTAVVEAEALKNFLIGKLSGGK